MTPVNGLGMLSRGLRIGITIGLHVPGESLWNNGIKQNAIFLARMFLNSPMGHSVVLLNTTNVPITNDLPWGDSGLETKGFAEGCHDIDVLIELGGQVSQHDTLALKGRGVRIVSYCCGFEYVMNMESIIFRRSMGGRIFINQHYDDIWMIPQVAETSKNFFSVFRRREAKVVPFVWDPFALETIATKIPDMGVYKPRSRAKRLTVIEPNIDVVKFCLYPILIAEKAFRNNSDDIEFVHVANTDRFVAEDTEFASLMRYLDLVAAGRISFIGRVNTPSFLAEHTDIMISHQWGLPLNYIYLECLWQGYPLIHNADLIKDMGFYYSGNDVDKGAELLHDVALNFDRDFENHRHENRRMVGRFLASNPDVVAEYDRLLADLFA